MLNTVKLLIAGVAISATTAACTEITSDGIVGVPDFEMTRTASGDSLIFDAAESIEGVWKSVSEDENDIYYVKWVDTSRAVIAFPYWGGSTFEVSQTEAITSRLGSGSYLNVRPFWGSDTPDTTGYMILRYVNKGDVLLLYVPDEDPITKAVETHVLDATEIEDDEIRIHSKGALDSLLVELDWEGWVVDGPLVLHRVAFWVPEE